MFACSSIIIFISVIRAAKSYIIFIKKQWMKKRVMKLWL